ncbi:DinB family protein [Nocardiopsis trehalosi]|jgi:uncharacterized damage-inducible protein DinB|uniref:DinB family protein n=1 Tax=Nocardiopsis trehalosi TaxID=109329 RepID=UPI000A06F1A8|nr:DinB family protein [Nocardiopsis trehalosi]
MSDTPPPGLVSASDGRLADLQRRAVAVAAGGEREILETFLDYLRYAVVRKIRGVPESDARHRPLGSATSLAGIAVHLTLVERNWFHRVLPGRTCEEVGLDLSDPEATWTVPEDATVDGVLAEYERVCAESRAIAAGYALDATAVHEELGPTSLRWILVHMVEETGRHAGHADILRERIDGVTGE